MRYDFEEIAEEFQLYYRTKSISHCDFAEINESEVAMVEETIYINKNLLDDKVYESEVREIVKKMWGSYAIAVWRWYREPDKLSGKRYFVLKVEVKRRFERKLSQLIKDIRKFKNGAYDDVKIESRIVE